MNGKPDETSVARRAGPSPCRQAQPDTLADKLEAVVASLPPGGVTLAELRDLVGPDGLLLLITLLTLVFMVPVSIPGVGAAFGCVTLLIGISRLRGRTLWLPGRLARRVLPTGKVRAGLTRGSIWLHRLARVSRPHRLNTWASGALADTLNNGGLILGALLLMAPVILVPLSNTLPALALLLLSVGLLERDGLCILFGHLANLVTLAYFAALLVGGGAALHATLRHAVVSAF